MSEKRVNLDNYVEFATRTESPNAPLNPEKFTQNDSRILHASIGVVTEGGELLDACKKYIYYGKPLDLQNLKEEMGDVMWYLAILSDVLEYSFEDVMNDNIAKLAKRYGEKFSEFNAINRDTVNELSHIGK